MKLLPFETRYRLETTKCPRCGGTGEVAMPTSAGERTCWNCQGTGRKPTREALQLYYAICELLGKPFRPEDKKGRFEPKHLETISGRDVEVGMMIARPRERPQLVASLREISSGSKLAQFEDGSTLAISPFDSFDRELSVAEVERVQEFLSAHVGKGALDHSG